MRRTTGQGGRAAAARDRSLRAGRLRRGVSGCVEEEEWAGTRWSGGGFQIVTLLFLLLLFQL